MKRVSIFSDLFSNSRTRRRPKSDKSQVFHSWWIPGRCFAARIEPFVRSLIQWIYFELKCYIWNYSISFGSLNRGSAQQAETDVITVTLILLAPLTRKISAGYLTTVGTSSRECTCGSMNSCDLVPKSQSTFFFFLLNKEPTPKQGQNPWITVYV